jgi:holo-[acyl-carrier protein] synthase
MIAGIGVDIVDVDRIAALLARHGERFLTRVFTDSEKQYALKGAHAAERLAGRFAVKEAVMKALGTGKSHGILWRDVETVRGVMGRPVVRLHGKAVRWMRWRGGDALHVSITHDGGKAVAFVVLESSRGIE